MYFWRVTFTLLLLVTGVICERQSIYGGKETRIVNFPYMINILCDYKGTFKHDCGGSLVAPLWVLTAGHCVYDNKMQMYPLKNFQLAAAISTLSREEDFPELRSVVKIATNNYRYQESEYGDILVLENDIALLRARNPFILNNFVRLVVLASPRLLSDRNPWEVFKGKCNYTGWGKTLSGGQFSNNLRVEYLSLMNKEKCRRRSLVFLDLDKTLCTAEKEVNACSGDLGAPLVCNGYQVGICSTLGRCPSKIKAPGTWTRVDLYYDWISTTIGLPSITTKGVVKAVSFVPTTRYPSPVLLFVCLIPTLKIKLYQFYYRCALRIQVLQKISRLLH